MCHELRRKIGKGARRMADREIVSVVIGLFAGLLAYIGWELHGISSNLKRIADGHNPKKTGNPGASPQ